MQPYSNPTRRNKEYDLNIFENGRQPQFFLKKEDDLNFWESEDDLKNNASKIQLKVKIITFLKMEPHTFCKEKDNPLQKMQLKTVFKWLWHRSG